MCPVDSSGRDKFLYSPDSCQYIYACINSKLRNVLSMDDPLFPYLLKIKPYHLLIFFPISWRGKYGLVYLFLFRFCRLDIPI